MSRLWYCRFRSLQRSNLVRPNPQLIVVRLSINRMSSTRISKLRPQLWRRLRSTNRPCTPLSLSLHLIILLLESSFREFLPLFSRIGKISPNSQSSENRANSSAESYPRWRMLFGDQRGRLRRWEPCPWAQISGWWPWRFRRLGWFPRSSYMRLHLWVLLPRGHRQPFRGRMILECLLLWQELWLESRNFAGAAVGWAEIIALWIIVSYEILWRGWAVQRTQALVR